ncbi:MAG: hypothetical protein V2A73_19720 [Pseudomonadota bacterium]
MTATANEDVDQDPDTVAMNAGDARGETNTPAADQAGVGASEQSAGEDSEAPADHEPVDSATQTSATLPTVGKKFSELTIDELRARYLELVGRPTTSSSRIYLPN